MAQAHTAVDSVANKAVSVCGKPRLLPALHPASAYVDFLVIFLDLSWPSDTYFTSDFFLNHVQRNSLSWKNHLQNEQESSCSIFIYETEIVMAAALYMMWII